MYKKPVITIRDWLKYARHRLLEKQISPADLDSELLLEFVIKKNRSYIHAHHETRLTNTQLIKLERLLNKRLRHHPIAYIVGEKEFYLRDFIVNKHTLVPRPETEAIIDVIRLTAKGLDKPSIIDVGTGSGCIGITVQLELPNSEVSISDVSRKALKVAKNNAKKHGAVVKIKKSFLLDSSTDTYDIIIANLPYVDKNWPQSPSIKHEPNLALFADDNGLSLIKKLIEQSSNHLNTNGHMILEADPIQHKAIIDYAKKYKLIHSLTDNYILKLSRP